MYKAGTLLLSAIISLGLAACGESELHKAMEGMGSSYKSMKEGGELASIRSQLEQFSAELDIAHQQAVAPEDQATFDEGLEKIGQLTTQLSLAVDAGDLEAARALLEKMGKTRKEYHEKLGVK